MSVERLAVLELDQHWVALGRIEEAERQLREGTLVSKNPVAKERGSSSRCCCAIAAGGVAALQDKHTIADWISLFL